MSWVDIYGRNSSYGFAPETWAQVKKMAKDRLIRNLRNPRVIVTTYGELVDHSRPTIDFGTPRNAVFHCLLGQISDDEEEQGRGLLSALVVHSQDGRPGVGFFDGAPNWGRDVSDRDKCWTQEVDRPAPRQSAAIVRRRFRQARSEARTCVACFDTGCRLYR
jgi:hypothetical protein